MNGPRKFATAVTPKATFGENAREEIIVATTLLESWMPFRKSNTSDRPMTTITRAVMSGFLSSYLDHDVGDHVGGLVSPVGGVAQVTVHFPLFQNLYDRIVIGAFRIVKQICQGFPVHAFDPVFERFCALGMVGSNTDVVFQPI